MYEKMIIAKGLQNPYKITPLFEGLLGPNIDILMIDLQLISSAETLDVNKYLTQEEIKKSNKYLFEIDRRSYLLRKMYLKIILSEYIGSHPKKIQINYSHYKKPFIKNSPMHFNTSHSMKKNVIAIHKKEPIGIDIETIKTIPNISELLKYFSSETEQKWVNKSKVNFYLLWTIKEAILKYRGTGFLTKNIPVLKQPPTPLTKTLFHTNHQKLNIYSKLFDHKIISICY